MVRDSHPKVCKKHYATKRLEGLPLELRTAFSEIHNELRRLYNVTVLYGGKCSVLYQVPQGVIAEAVIGKESIEWRHKKRGVWHDREHGGSKKILAECYAEH